MPALSNHSYEVAVSGEAGDDSVAISEPVTPAVTRNSMAQCVFHLSNIKDDTEVTGNYVRQDALHVPTFRIVAQEFPVRRSGIPHR